MKKLILASLILTSSQMVMAVNWVDTGVINQINGSKSYIDVDSVKTHRFDGSNKKYITFWHKQIYPNVQKWNNKYYIDSTTFKYFDCQNERLNFSDIYYFNSQNIMVHQETAIIDTSSSKSWYGVPPNSVGDLEMKQICTYFKQKGVI